MPRYTICAIVDNPGERQLVQEWLKRWASQLRYVSRNYGCGCCVDMYDVDASQTAVNELPPHLIAHSEGTRQGKKVRR
jgi:hypothetical protein